MADSAAASLSKPKNWFRRLIQRLCTYLFYATIIAIIGPVLWLWWLYWDNRDWLRDSRNDDPFTHYSSSVSGNIDMTFDQPLADGGTIRINNRPAMFIADMQPDVPESERLFPTFRDAVDFAESSKLPLLPSVSMIHYRMKLEDDELIERIQLVQQKRLLDLLDEMDARLDPDKVVQLGALAFVRAARIIGGQAENEETTSPLQRQVDALIREFESGVRSAGREFNEAEVASRYARDAELTRLFRTQRFLMGRMPEGADKALIDLLNANPDLHGQLVSINACYDVLDNPAETAHLLDPTRHSMDPNVYFLPTARSPENEYYERTYGTLPLPAEVVWMSNISAAVRSGKLDLSPRPDSGWYDYKLYALASLVRKDKSFALSTNKIRASELYRSFMDETFRSALTATRETHVLRLEPIPMGLHGLPYGKLALSPRFSCEPAPEVYWRFADAYRFLRTRLGDDRELAETTEALEKRCRQLAAISFLELGIPPDGVLSEELPEGYPQSALDEIRPWLQALLKDPKMNQDTRRFMDIASGRKWGIVGVRLRRVTYEYDESPEIMGYELKPEKAIYWAPVLVAAEFSRSIPQTEFAKFCSQFDRVDACLGALGAKSDDSEEEQIPLTGVLAVISLFAAGIVAWMIFRRVQARKRPRRVRWKLRFAILSSAVLLAVPLVWYGPMIFALQILPRMDMPWWYRSAYAGFFLDKQLEIRSKFAGFSTSGYDGFVASALRSPVRSVRESALNLPIGRFRWQSCTGEQTRKALLEIAMTRGYDEAEVALEDLMYDTSSSPEVAQRHFDEIGPILSRFDYAPKLVLNCTGLIEATGAKSEDIAMLERAIRAERSGFLYFVGLMTLLRCSPEILPYERLVQLDVLAPSTTNLEQSPNLAMGTFTLEAHMRNVDSRLRSMDENSYGRTIDRTHENDLRKATKDERIAELVHWRQRNGKTDTIRTATDILSYMDENVCDRYLELTLDWLLSIPAGDEVQERYTRVLAALCYFPHNRRGESFRNAVRQIRDSGRWTNLNASPRVADYNPDKPVATWGDNFESVLNPPHTPQGLEMENFVPMGFFEASPFLTSGTQQN